MTVLREVKVLLRDNWQTSRPGRKLAVPEPEILHEREVSQERTRTQDLVVIEDGGTVQHEPQSFAWSEERVDAAVTVNARASTRVVDRDNGVRRDSRTLLFGYVNESESTDQYGLSPGETEAHGGILGEARKILLEHRKIGVGSWDHLNPSEINDVSNTVGKNQSRGLIEVTPTEYAREI